MGRDGGRSVVGGWVSQPFAFVYRGPGYMPEVSEEKRERSDTGFQAECSFVIKLLSCRAIKGKLQIP